MSASSNPVLVEVMRGALVESRHAGAVAIADATGKLALALGDVERPIYPRSAVKAAKSAKPVKTAKKTEAKAAKKSATKAKAAKKSTAKAAKKAAGKPAKKAAPKAKPKKKGGK